MENDCTECRGKYQLTKEISLNVYSTIPAETTEQNKANRTKTHAGTSVRGLMSKRKN